VVSARWLALSCAALAAAAGAALALVACRQVLGVQDLGVRDGGPEGGLEGGSSGACSARATTEDCYSCCAELDGGDQGFFSGGLHACVCNSECSADCTNYCGPTAPADLTDCDLCVYLSAIPDAGQCHDPAAAAAQASAGANAIYRCLTTCAAPSDGECAGLTTLRGCYDCCVGKHWSSYGLLFGPPAQACVCDAGCAASCPDYCPNSAVDQGACTRCTLGSLTDGGCAATGASLCHDPDCLAMTACMQLCAQTQ
jgi:hypothetical protein